MELKLDKFSGNRNPVNGRFLPKSIPFNKGKKWSEWFPKEAWEKALKNLEKGRGRKNIGGWNKKECIALTKDYKWVGIFESATAAARKFNINRRNICSVCNKKRKSAGGYIFFWSDDEELLKIL